MKTYAKLLKKMIILLLTLSNGVLLAQFTRQQAIQKVLNEIVVADTGQINVYSAYDLLTNNDSIVLAFDTTLVCPYMEKLVNVTTKNRIKMTTPAGAN